MKVGSGHFTKILNTGTKAKSEVGGIVIVFEGFKSYSITGDNFKINSSID